MYINLDGYNKIMDRSRLAQQQEFDNNLRTKADARAQAAADEQARQWKILAEGQDAVADAGKSGLQRMDGKAYDWRSTLGVTDNQAQQPLGGAAPTDAAMKPTVNRQSVDAFDPAAGIPAAQVSLQPPSAPAPTQGKQSPSSQGTGSPFDDQLADIKARVRIAGASRDAKMYSAAMADYANMRKQKMAMEISDHIDRADATELARLSDSVTADPTNRVKMIYDKDTGKIVLQEETGKVQTLSKNELKKYLIGRATGNLDTMFGAQADARARAKEEDKESTDVAKAMGTIRYQEKHGDYLSDQTEINRVRAENGSLKASADATKRWDTLRGKVTNTYEDAEGTKHTSDILKTAALQSIDVAMRSGADPETAQLRAAETQSALVEKAKELVAAEKAQDKKSKITMDDAMRKIYGMVTAQAQKPQGAPQPAPTGALQKTMTATDLAAQAKVNHGLARSTPTDRSPHALPKPLGEMSIRELDAIPPGHPSYQPAQDEIRRQVAARRDSSRFFDPSN